MKRKSVSGANSFARFGLKPHHARTNSTFRGGRRQ